MNSILTKIMIYVAGIAVLCGLVFIIFKQNQIEQQQTAIEKSIIEQKNLLDEIERSGGVYATKEDIESFLKKSGFNTQNIKNDLKKLGAEVNSGNVITVNSNKGGIKKTDVTSTSVGPENPDANLLTDKLELSCGGNKFDTSLCDPFGYQARQQNLAFNERFENVDVPLGEVGFSAWKEKPWSLDIKQRQYKVVTVVGLDSNDRSYYYNKFSVNVGGKDYDIKIATAETKQEVPKASMHWWNPHLFLNAGAGVNMNEMKPNVNLGVSLGIMSYGQSRKTPDLSIMQIGGGFDFVSKRPQVSLAPINVNIGNLFNSRLITNTYIGPTVQLNTAAAWTAGVGLSVGF